jgi:hypothetical protein
MEGTTLRSEAAGAYHIRSALALVSLQHELRNRDPRSDIYVGITYIMYVSHDGRVRKMMCLS